MNTELKESIIKRKDSDHPICCNQYEVSMAKYNDLCDKVSSEALTVAEITAKFGEEYSEEAKMQLTKTQYDVGTLFECIPLTLKVDTLMKDIISEFSLKCIGNCFRNTEYRTNDIWNRDTASCFKTERDEYDSYVFMEHTEYIYNGKVNLTIKIHYEFSNGCCHKLLECEVNNNNVYWTQSNEPKTSMYSRDYDVYEKAEYFYMQRKLREKIEAFLAKNKVVEYDSSKGDSL